MIATDLLLDIASEKNGYKIGDPWRFSEFSLAAVVPLLREIDVERLYRLPTEVGKDLKIKDSGSIDKMEITNRGSLPILLKAGSVLAGATQPRALTCSQVVMAGEKVIADCVCVHASMGIRAGQEVKYSNYSPTGLRSTFYRGYEVSYDDIQPETTGWGQTPIASFNYTASLQSDIWGGVKNHAKNLASSYSSLTAAVANGRIEPTAHFIEVEGSTPSWRTASDDLAGRINESKDRFEAVLKNTPHFDNQVGLCLLTLSGLESVESFDHPGSWQALRDSILESEADKIADVTDQDGVFEFKADKAKATIRELLTVKFEESVTVDKAETQTILLQSPKLTGEVVFLNSQPIHCTFVKKV